MWPDQDMLIEGVMKTYAIIIQNPVYGFSNRN